MSLIRQWRPGMDSVTSRRLNTKSIPVVSATSDLVSGGGQFAGQVVLCLEDNLLYRYDGTNWTAFDATGGGFSILGADAPSKSHEVRYLARVAQSIPNATDTKLQFPTVFANAANDVTASGTGNTDFLLNRGGVWHVAVGTRYVANAGGGERHLFLQTGASFVVANRFSFRSDGNVGNTAISLSTSAQIRVAAATTIIVGAFQNSGASVNTDPLDAASVHGAVHIALTWLRPL